MIYEIFTPFWTHVVVLPVFAALSTFVVVRAILNWYRGHMTRRAISRRLAAIRGA